MVVKPENLTETSLQFFGRVSASISHELKNVLAIINENAGLLEDFTLMGDRGIPTGSPTVSTKPSPILT